MYCSTRHRFELIEQITKRTRSVYIIIVSCLRCSKKIDVKYKYGKITTKGEVSGKTKAIIIAYLRKRRLITFY